MKPSALPVILLLVSSAGCAHHHPPAAPKPPVEAAKPKSEAKNPYTKPLLSPGAQFAAMPPAVQNTVRAQVGSAEVNDVVKETRDGQSIYKIYFQAYQIYPPLYVAADGSVLRSDFSVAVHAPESNHAGLKLSDLPPDALKVVHDRASSTEIAAISKETWGDRIVYIVAFKDETEHPKLYITADGTVFAESPK